jgi:hypothetical protein
VPAVALVNPAQLAEDAAAKLTIPNPPGAVVRPMVRFRDGRVGGVAGMPMWLWISAGTWRSPPPVHLAAGPVWVDVRAVALDQTWTFGDGQHRTCRGRGTEFRAGHPARSGSPDCGYHYARTSRRQPGGAYSVGATVRWRITWVGSGNTAGELPLFAAHAEFPYVVREARAQLVTP